VLSTRFTREYGVELPIVSAGMAFVARAPLAAAVSGAGGFGTLGVSGMTPEQLEGEIDSVRALTDRPFGVNLIPRFATDDALHVCAAARIAAVTFFWDDPQPSWIEMLKAAGVSVWVQVGSVEEAESAVAAGADALIVQGGEAGGHNRSAAGTMSLVPNVVDAVTPVLVLAAGGIADGRGLAAALALGADAGVLGTRFLVSDESDAHPEYQDRIVAAGVADTARHGIFGFDFPDAPVRGLRNAIVREWEGRDRPPPYEGLDPGDQPVVGQASVYGQELPLTRFTGLPPVRGAEGDFDQMSLLAGETAGLVGERRPAAELVRELAEQAAACLEGLTTAMRT
jgi:NAD(P)H-dependent flavin oxidoreductase YrpB (nitropropane dioxygenase family)